MTVLSDVAIFDYIMRGDIEIDPLDMNNIQPASVDLHLGNEFKSFHPQLEGYYIDPRLPQSMDTRTGTHFYLHPREFVLAMIKERVKLAPHIAGRAEGKSSIGRLGLTIHVTAGFFDPGWNGRGTLELYNMSPYPILLVPDMKICQMSFHLLDQPARRPYGHPSLNSKYQGSQSVVESKMHQNFTK